MRCFDRVSCVTALTVAIGLCFVSGCGGPSYEGAERGAVTGNVTMDGKPLAYGNILFMPQRAEWLRA